MAAPFKTKVQVFVLFPPLEHAPDQITSRVSVAESVMLVPAVKEACMELPTATLMPAGLDVTRSPLRPVAVTVSTNWDGGGGLEVRASEGVIIRAGERVRFRTPEPVDAEFVVVCLLGLQRESDHRGRE